MTTKDHGKKRNAQQKGWLKVNRFSSRGYGIIESEDGGGEVFCHIGAFVSFGNGMPQEAIYNLEYRRRLLFRLAFDEKSDRLVAKDVWPIRELMGPDGTIIELPLRGNKVRAQVEAERAAKLEQDESQPRTEGFGALVAALR
jgi:hypothetical protein